MSLTPAHERIIAGASGQRIQAGYPSIRRQFPSGRWLAPGNDYAHSATHLVNRRTTTVPNPYQLRSYIAASVFLHASDGWQYLSRALGAVALGDSRTAIHLAYYAELRAAASILATAGVALLNDGHAAYGGRGLPTVIAGKAVSTVAGRPGRNLSTHVFAWEALQFWATQSIAAEVVGRSIQPGGSQLGDWMDRFGIGLTARGLASTWLGEWGLDLQRLSQDRDSRNEVSYHPNNLGPTERIDGGQIARLLQDVWAVLEPGPGGFEALDRFLLRRRLESGFRVVEGRSAGQAQRRFEARVRQTVRDLSPIGLPGAEWVEFLTRRAAPDDPRVLALAGGRASVGVPGHHEQVLSRAVLLLRLATALARDFLVASRGSSIELSFWWVKFGEDRGLWEPGDTPSDISDLWADVTEALGELATWLATATGSGGLRAWISGNAMPVATLSNVDRAGLWGLLS